MNHTQSVTCALLMATWLAGCQSQPNDAGFADVQHHVSQQTGLTVQWDGHTADDRAVAAAVAELLSHELSADQAVQIALLNNPRLQATFEDLGIAQADLVQAGLLKNPVFDLGVRFPDRSPATTYLDIAVVADFLDVALLPARKKLAAAQLAETRAMVCDEVLDLAAQTREDFYAYQAARQMAELRRAAARTATAALAAAQKLHDAGNVSDLDLAGGRAQDVRARIDLADAEAAAALAREDVNERMGLGDQAALWTAAPRLPDLPAADASDQDLESQAIQQRQDLAAARQRVKRQARTLGLTADFRYFDSATIGPEFERETDHQWRIGPTVAAPLPLFDQGQAKVSRAQALLRQSELRYAALILDVRREVRSGRARLSHARAKALLYRDELLPVERELRDRTQLRYNGMYTGVFELLRARQAQLEATGQYVDALRDYWTARARLERAVGGRLPATRATTQGDPP